MKKRILSALIAAAVAVNNLCGVTFVSAEEQEQAVSLLGNRVVFGERFFNDGSEIGGTGVSDNIDFIDYPENSIEEETELEFEEKVDTGIAEREEVSPQAEGEIIDSGNCGAQDGNVVWTLDSNGLLVISGEGMMRDYKQGGYNPWFYDDRVKNCVIKNGVTHIGNCSFYFCRYMTSIEIPDSVTSIGATAFGCCTRLTSINIPSSVSSIGSGAFLSCDNLASINIPDGITDIGSNTFRHCESLTSIEIPNSVTSIGGEAFCYCTNLSTINIPRGVKEIGNEAFKNCTSLTSIDIPDGVTDIGYSTFQDCINMVSIRIPDSLQYIGASAFENCYKLTSIYIPKNALTISEKAFKNCESLTSIIIPDGVLGIGKEMFYGCKNLVSIEIPDSVMSLGNSAFSGCSNLTSIELSDSITSMDDKAFYGCSKLTSIRIPKYIARIGSMAFCRCYELTSVEIPKGVVSIGSSAFSSCTNLTSIDIPDSVESIEGGAFMECSSLISAEIPNKVTNITRNMFYGCTALSSVKIPSNVTNIDEDAFGECSALTSIELPDKITAIGDGAFYGCTGLTSIKMPDNLKTIGDVAFRKCESLISVEIPNGVTIINIATFYGCSNLVSVKLPADITKIRTHAFCGCSSLQDVYYAGSESDWAEIQIYKCVWDRYEYPAYDYLKDATIHYNSADDDSPDIKIISGVLLKTDTCQINWHCAYQLPENGTPQEAEVFVYVSYIGGLEEIIDLFNEKAESGLPMPWELDPYNIPKTAVTKLTINGNRNEMLRILPETFKGYTALTNLKIFNIYEIGDSAFEGCRSLRMVENLNKAGNETLKRIGANAFKNCSMLDSLTVGKAVGYIGEGAFDGCSRLVIGCYINTYAQRYFEKKNISYKVLDADISNYVPFYSATGDQTTMLDIGWGDSLFTTPTTTYSNRLATLGLALSADTEVSWQRTENTLKRLGFEEGNIKSCSYGVQGIFSPGVTFAYKDITINGQKKPLLIIAVRGTTIDLNQFWGWGDIITDILGVVGGFSISAEHTAFDFGNFLRDHGISDADIANGGKIFITGHSLGGAVANLLAKKYSDKYFGEQSVYCYTYASPFTAVIKPADKKYNNIHNLIHGEDLVPHTGVGLSCGTRYGRNYDDFYTYYIAGFKDNFYTLTGKKYNPDALDLLAPHDVSVYMAYVMSTSDLTKYKNGRQTVIRIACPVDAEVYGSNGELVGTVKDGNAETLSEGAYVFVEGEEKYFVLADDDDYKIVIKGTDKGTMEYTVYSYSEGDGELLDIKTFSNVSIEKDKEFASYVSVWDKNDESIDDEEKIDVPDVPLYVVDENGDPEKEVLPDGNGTELPILPPIMLGDLNNDSRVTIADARMLLQAASGNRTLTEEQQAAADVNGDGKITIADARWLLQVASGSRVL